MTLVKTTEMRNLVGKRGCKCIQTTCSQAAFSVCLACCVILVFDSFNTFLQAEEPLSRYTIPEVISESDGVQSVDLEEPDVLKDFDSI